MITEDETKKILQRSFEYIVALTDNLQNIKFQMNHYFYQGFKEKLKISFTRSLAHRDEWDTVVGHDPQVERRLIELKTQIQGIRGSLQEGSASSADFS
mmetsp:Transcript_17052/g.46759  ORF Transcript_17052/g.46759 Transcript_17052/m.46759 type:complete len:98 (-) Transcript_17052:22-315(-)